MKISNEVLTILGECRTEGNVLFLPDRQLDRPTYQAVNKVLTNIGGKWNRKAKGHVFADGDPAELLDNLILTGETVDLKKQYQFFPTPRNIAGIPRASIACSAVHLVDFIRFLTETNSALSQPNAFPLASPLASPMASPFAFPRASPLASILSNTSHIVFEPPSFLTSFAVSSKRGSPVITVNSLNNSS